LTKHDGFANLDRAFHEVALGGAKTDFFGLSKAGEESKLIEVADRFAPLSVDTPDQRLGFLDAERIDLGAIFLAEPEGLQPLRWVALPGRSLYPNSKAQRRALIPLS